jgi:hypothetical protein
LKGLFKNDSISVLLQQSRIKNPLFVTVNKTIVF